MIIEEEGECCKLSTTRKIENVDPSNCGIYCIRNKINNKVYIGSSKRIKNETIDGKNIQGRIDRHFQMLQYNRHGRRNKQSMEVDHLQLSYNKYGKDAFEWKILLLCKEEDLITWEQYFMDYFKVSDNKYGYNENPRADRMVITEKMKEKLRKANLGKKHTEESKRKMSESRKGKKHTEQARKNMSKAQQWQSPLIETINEWIILYQNGMTTGKIAKKYNTTSATVLRKLKCNNINIKQKRNNKEDIKKWIELYNQGFTISEISKQYNVCTGTIGWQLKKNNIKIRPRGVDSPKSKYLKFKDEWSELYDSGATVKEISKKYNVPFTNIQRILRINGTKMRQGGKKKKYMQFLNEWAILRKQGLTYQEIGNRYGGISYVIVLQYLNKYYKEPVV